MHKTTNRDVLHDPILKTTAACDGCGRAYIYIASGGVRCMECGVDSGGRLWFLPKPEDFTGDDLASRTRRRKLVAMYRAEAPHA